MTVYDGKSKTKRNSGDRKRARESRCIVEWDLEVICQLNHEFIKFFNLVIIMISHNVIQYYYRISLQKLY